MATVPDAVLVRLRAAADRVAASYGLEIFDLQFRREPIGMVLRVIVDRVGPPSPGDGAEAAPTGAFGEGGAASAATEEPVGIDDCRRVSQDLGTLLDVEDGLTAGHEHYTLEVSSPGLDRPLRGEADYRRFTGRLAKIVTSEPVDGQSHFEGRLDGVDGNEVLLTQGRRTHRVPIAAIRRARLEVEF